MRLPKGQNFSAYTAPSFKFWYDEKWYTVQGAETMARTGTKDDIATMRSEYTRMRDTAQKRLKRLEKMFPESQAVKSHPHGFAKLKDLDPRDFPKAFAELAKFLKAKGSTVTGQRQIKEKTMKTWQNQGLPVNEKNYDRVIKILEEARKQKIVYGSDKVVSLAESTMELDDEDFNSWLDHLDELLPHSDDDDFDEFVNHWKTVKESWGETIDIDELIRDLGW